MITLKKTSLLSGFMLSVLSMTLAGCSMYSEDHVTPNKVQVEEQKFVEEIPVHEITAAKIVGISQYYESHGSGPVDLTVTYDPRSSGNTAMTASNEVSKLVGAFRKEGLREIKGTILPVNQQGEKSVAIVSFLSYNALAPKDCTLMEGFEGQNITVAEEYKLGCTVDTVFARQIARPKDLKGRGISATTTEGRSASNIVDMERSGAPKEALEGETASED